MKSPSSLLLCFMLILGVLGAPTVTERKVMNSESWPESIKIETPRYAPRGENELTNQQRLQRGLGPAKPARLYGQQRDIQKRLNPAPSTVTSDSTTWKFSGCYTAGGNVRKADSVTAASNLEAVQACADKAQTNEDFLVGYPDSGSYHCMLGVPEPVNGQACDSDNYGWYKLA